MNHKKELLRSLWVGAWRLRGFGSRAKGFRVGGLQTFPEIVLLELRVRA